MYSSLVRQGQPFAIFRQRARLRRWAAGVLVLWLFGLVSGVAHACMAQDTSGTPSGRAEIASATDPGHGVAHSRASHVQHSHHDQPGGANCQDFCQKSAVSIPPLKALDNLLNPAVLPPAPAIAVLPPAAVPDHLAVPLAEGGQPPPIPIAFLRLAL